MAHFVPSAGRRPKVRPRRSPIVESGAGSVGRFIERLGLTHDEEIDRLIAAHAAKLASSTMPTLIIHGLADDLVPIEVATSTTDLLTASDVTTEFVEGAGHNNLLVADPGRYMDAIDQLIGTTRG